MPYASQIVSHKIEITLIKVIKYNFSEVSAENLLHNVDYIQ